MKFTLPLAVAAFVAWSGMAGAVTLSFTSGGALGNVGTSKNQLIGTQPFPGTLDVTSVDVSQDGGTVFALQGNDLVVDLTFHLVGGGTVVVADAIINWRTTSQGKVTGFGIVPAPGMAAVVVDGFSVIGAAGANDGSNMFLKSPVNAYGALTVNDPINGNAATAKTLLDDLNALLPPPDGASMRVQKEASYDPDTGNIDYTITVTNTSTTDSLSNLTVDDTLTADAGTGEDLSALLEIGSLTDNGTSGDSLDDVNDLDYDVLGPLDSITYRLTVAATTDYPSVTVFENLATATAQSFVDTGEPGLTDETLAPEFSVESSAAGNGQTGEGNGSPTLLDLSNSQMTVKKTADTSGLQTPAQPGDVIVYRIKVKNTGTVDLENFSLNDALTADEAYLSGGTDDDVLEVGETNFFSASYTITDADLAAGHVDNLAVATGYTGSGTPVVVESSATGNSDETGEATVVTFGLIDQIEEDLKKVLEADLRQTIQMQQARFGRMSKSALETLKDGASEDCGVVQPLDAEGAASTEEGALVADLSVTGETVDCATGERRIVTADLTSSTLEGMGQQIAGAFSIQHERFADADAVRGRFVGGYVTSNEVTGPAAGEILGFGLNAGIYGADRLSSNLYLDHYIAVAAGRHSFDLDFGALDPINATGDYAYLAGFGGVALSSSVTTGGMEVAPRLALDVAYAAAGDVSVIARQFDRIETGTLSLSNYQGARATAEVVLSNLNDAAAAGGTEFEVAPRLFCDVALGQGSDKNCGYGAYVSLNTNYGNGLDYSALVDFEDSEDRSALTFALKRVKTLAGGSGAVISTMGVTETGDLAFGQMLNLRF